MSAEETVDGCYLICPYCGYKHDDMWEWSSDDGEQEEWECHRCERVFIAQRNIDISYTGTPIDEKTGGQDAKEG